MNPYDFKNMKFVVIAGEKRITNLMQSAGVFEPFKVIGNITQFDVSNLSREMVPEYRDSVKSLMEKDGYQVSAILFPGMPEFNYVDPSVKVVSSGKKFSLMEDIVNAFK